MLSLAMNAGVMTTNLKAELPGYGTIWFDPPSHDKCAEFWQHSQTVSCLIPTRIGYISCSVKQLYKYFWLQTG